MAEIRRLDGSAVEVGTLGRNEKIAEVLRKLGEKNEAGRLASIAVISLTPEGWWDTAWAWPSSTAQFPWALAMHGAIALLAQDMAHRAIVGPAMPEPKKDDPA